VAVIRSPLATSAAAQRRRASIGTLPGEPALASRAHCIRAEVVGQQRASASRSSRERRRVATGRNGDGYARARAIARIRWRFRIVNGVDEHATRVRLARPRLTSRGATEHTGVEVGGGEAARFTDTGAAAIRRDLRRPSHPRPPRRRAHLAGGDAAAHEQHAPSLELQEDRKERLIRHDRVPF
jgi:hypothetical protein